MKSFIFNAIEANENSFLLDETDEHLFFHLEQNGNDVSFQILVFDQFFKFRNFILWKGYGSRTYVFYKLNSAESTEFVEYYL